MATSMLIPSVDDAAETHAPASDARCGATTLLSGERFTCILPARHGGMHECGARIWRPRSEDLS